MKRFTVGLGRRGFLGGVLAGGLGVAAVLVRRRGADLSGGDANARELAAARRRGRVRAAEPWAPLREEVISPDELVPSGSDLAG